MMSSDMGSVPDLPVSQSVVYIILMAVLVTLSFDLHCF